MHLKTGAASDEKLFEMLKELRQKEAKKKSLPPFVIFLENSLQDMANSLSYHIGGNGKMPGR
jgi:ATP-dependent DNA helicase RecQ